MLTTAIIEQTRTVPVDETWKRALTATWTESQATGWPVQSAFPEPRPRPAPRQAASVAIWGNRSWQGKRAPPLRRAARAWRSLAILSPTPLICMLFTPNHLDVWAERREDSSLHGSLF